jgi:hypothetical protein
VRTWAEAVLPALRDLATAAALLWLTVSDSWVAIGVAAALVASRAVRRFGTRSPGLAQ